MSMKLTPAASILTTASLGLGVGSGTSSKRSASGPPNSWTRIAFIGWSLRVSVMEEKRSRSAACIVHRVGRQFLGPIVLILRRIRRPRLRRDERGNLLRILVAQTA